MEITFHIHYKTSGNEKVYITGSLPEMGLCHSSNALPMTRKDNDRWSIAVTLPDNTGNFGYRYLIKSGETVVRREEGSAHLMRLAPSHSPSYDVYDRWKETPKDKIFYSTCFQKSILKRDNNHLPLKLDINPGETVIMVENPLVTPDCKMAVVGQHKSLGDWNPDNAITMDDRFYPTWYVKLPSDISSGQEYKFIITDATTGKLKEWEEGENRRIDVIPSPHKATIIKGLRFNNTHRRWRGAGCAVPVFSIRTKDDRGCGDFTDIMTMCDWLAETGQKFLQILPVNDTTTDGSNADSYPYSAISSFALNPLYIRPDKIGMPDDAKAVKTYLKRAAQLNAKTQIDYAAVLKLKMDYLRLIYAKDGAKTLRSNSFRQFFDDNSDWLRPYAAFCILRDRYSTADFTRWGKDSVYSKSKLQEVLASEAEEAGFIYYIQYHLDRQLSEAVDYARSLGISVKGDLPIGISRASADAWSNPELFNLGCQAGAPPDDFAVNGQNWGFPTYNWERMAKDNFQWWKNRFRNMEKYFGAYRIDHLLGFFRIWEIPAGNIHGLLGMFSPALPMAKSELENAFGFTLDPSIHCIPVADDETLSILFGKYAENIKKKYLKRIKGNLYTPKKSVDTQQKVAGLLSDAKTLEDKTAYRGLMTLLDDVLFIEDIRQAGLYHPRICGDKTFAFKRLTENQRNAYTKLHHHFYYERHNELWKESALKKLPELISATDMLTCGEDLGMIPASVPQVMNQLEILSLEIERMPKEPWVRFGNPSNYPYLSVCSTSTHDMGGIRIWWEENRDNTDWYYHNTLGHCGETPTTASPEICREILWRNLESPSMLTIIPLQDWLSLSGDLRKPTPSGEQINVPADPNHYWGYRMHITVEDMIKNSDLNGIIREMIIASGR